MGLLGSGYNVITLQTLIETKSSPQEKKRYNGEAQPQWARGISVTNSNIDTTSEEGKTVEPIVG